MSTTRNKPSRRRLAQIYTEAAKRLANSGAFYACSALSDCSDWNERAQQHCNFEGFFKPEENDGDLGWWGDKHVARWDQNPQNNFLQTPRIIALLLMAELAKDGQLD